MSENYQYAECKHCGKSVMEGEIHSCRNMLLAEIADSHATMLRQEEKIVRLEKALKKIRELNQRDNDDVPRWIAETISEALAARP